MTPIREHLQTAIPKPNSNRNSSPGVSVTLMSNDFPMPMDSKIDFEKYESTEELPMFSPPKRAKTTEQAKVPDFIRVLEPMVYNQIQNQNTRQTETKKSKHEEQVSDSIVKHTLNTNHIYFPGACQFVSLVLMLIFTRNNILYSDSNRKTGYLFSLHTTSS